MSESKRRKAPYCHMHLLPSDECGCLENRFREYRLDRIESDLAEIKDRLKRADPGYDIDRQTIATLEEYESRMAGEQGKSR